MFVIVGLGNPGREYEKTRHNVGFMFVDNISSEANISISQSKFNSFYGRGVWLGHDVILLKPQTYMNLSGESVSKILSFFKIPIECLIVVCDDLDQAFGAVKMRTGGGHGGHNGIRSILEQTSSDQFHRVKIGIGKPEHKSAVVNWVLNPFKPEEVDFLEKESFSTAQSRVLSVMTQVTKQKK